VSNSVRPHRWQPTRLCRPWDSPGRNTGVGCHSFSSAWKWKWSRSVMSDSSLPHGLQPIRLLHPWDFPSKSTGVGCHCFLCSYLLGLEKQIPIFWTLLMLIYLGGLCGLSQIGFLPRCGKILFFFSDFVLSNYLWFYWLICRSVFACW